jgi:Flp pilus assembly protein TadG
MMKDMKRVNVRKNRRRGGSALEMALCMPWLVFLFVGAFDWGFYAHALISTESAARVAALATSARAGTAGDQTLACKYAYEELKIISNVASASPNCSALPVIVTATSSPTGGPDGQAVSTVTVTYQTQTLIPIPGVLKSQATFNRTVTMRLRG